MKGDTRRQASATEYYQREANNIVDFNFDGEVKYQSEVQTFLYHLVRIEQAVTVVLAKKKLTYQDIDTFGEVFIGLTMSEDFWSVFRLERYRFSINVEIFHLGYEKYLQSTKRVNADKYLSNSHRNILLVIRLIKFIYKKYGQILANLQNPIVGRANKVLSSYINNLVNIHSEIYAVVVRLPLRICSSDNVLSINDYSLHLKKLTHDYLNNIKMNSVLKRKIGYIMTYDPGNPFISGAEVVMFFDRRYLTNPRKTRNEIFSYWCKNAENHEVSGQVNLPWPKSVHSISTVWKLTNENSNIEKFVKKIVLPLATKDLYIRDKGLAPGENMFTKGQICKQVKVRI